MLFLFYYNYALLFFIIFAPILKLCHWTHFSQPVSTFFNIHTISTFLCSYLYIGIWTHPRPLSSPRLTKQSSLHNPLILFVRRINLIQAVFTLSFLRLLIMLSSIDIPYIIMRQILIVFLYRLSNIVHTFIHQC